LNTDLLSPIITALIAGPLGAYISFWFNKDKYKAEEHLAIATGASQAVEAISSVLDSLREELDQTKDELVKATIQLAEMRLQNEKLIKENKHLVSKIEELKCMVEKMSNQTIDKDQQL
jgi:ribosomal protein L29